MKKLVFIFIFLILFSLFASAFEINPDEWTDCELKENGSKYCTGNLPEEFEACYIHPGGMGDCVAKQTDDDNFRKSVRTIPENPTYKEDTIVEVSMPKKICGEEYVFEEPIIEDGTIYLNYFAINLEGPRCPSCSNTRELFVEQINLGKLLMTNYDLYLIESIKLDHCDGKEPELTHTPEIPENKSLKRQGIFHYYFEVEQNMVEYIKREAYKHRGENSGGDSASSKSTSTTKPAEDTEETELSIDTSSNSEENIVGNETLLADESVDEPAINSTPPQETLTTSSNNIQEQQNIFASVFTGLLTWISSMFS